MHSVLLSGIVSESRRSMVACVAVLSLIFHEDLCTSHHCVVVGEYTMQSSLESVPCHS